jgi:hypothetical protein
MLKPQDVLVVLALAAVPPEDRTFAKLAAALSMSSSEVHAAVKRATTSGLLDAERSVRKAALLEFLLHGLRYVFPAEWKGVSRGVPTSYATAPLSSRMHASDLPPVWPYPEGTVRGEGLVPLYRSVPSAALASPPLHELLALVDAVRSGRARERRMAADELEARLSP